MFWTACLFLVYIASSCLGLYLIKLAGNWKSVPFAAGFGLYAAGAIMWMVILRLLPLSFAFPIAAGSLVIGTLLTGVFLLGESVTSGHIAGSFFIVIGIVLIAANR
jgi:multidrug transporter EmrE-like cation transporter